MIIRPARISDYAQLISLYNNFVGGRRYNKKGGDSFKKVLKSPVNFIFIAEEDKRLVGFISFSVRSLVRYPKPIGEIDELYVVPEFRMKGVGKATMSRILRKARNLGCDKMFVESAFKWKGAHKFYVSAGFKKGGYYFDKKL